MNEIEETRFRIPCPARTVSMDHNAETAYFEIPQDASHGVRLICKHPDCAKKHSRRPRFRYCAFCHTAVSYQNFHLRHSHVGDRNPTQSELNPSKGSSTCISTDFSLEDSSQLNQQEREWLELLREHPAMQGYGADDTKQWMGAVQAVTPVSLHSWMTNVLMHPVIEFGPTDNTPFYSAQDPFASDEDVNDLMELMDESVTSAISSGYFSDF